MMSRPRHDLEAQRARSSARFVATYANAQMHRQAEARRALAHRRDRREEPRREVEEAPRAPLAPVQVEERRRARRSRRAPGATARSRRSSAAIERPEAVGVRARPTSGSTPGACIAHASLPGRPQLPRRAALELVPVEAEALRAVAAEHELEVAREEVEDLRERAEQDRRRRRGARAERRQLAARSARPRRRGRAASSSVLRPSRSRPIAPVIARDERHVGHRLVREEEPVRHRREDERAEQPRAAPEDLRDALVEEVHRDERQEEVRRAHDPLGVRGRARRPRR